MKIFVLADGDQEAELRKVPLSEKVFISRESLLSSLYKDYDAFLFLSGLPDLKDLFSLEGKPVILNSVTETLSDLKLPSWISRINGWTGFLQRETWEVASRNPQLAAGLVRQLNRKPVIVKDEPGLVAARVISMIINEAFYALGDQVSSIEDMDRAMKLGTNYPLGPFEWAEQIGIKNIYDLLKKLSATESRYQPAPALLKLIE